MKNIFAILLAVLLVLTLGFTNEIPLKGSYSIEPPKPKENYFGMKWGSNQKYVQEIVGLPFDEKTTRKGTYYNSEPVFGFETEQTDYYFNGFGELSNIVIKITKNSTFLAGDFINYNSADNPNQGILYDRKRGYYQLKYELINEYGDPVVASETKAWEDIPDQNWPTASLFNNPDNNSFPRLIIYTKWETDRSAITLAMDSFDDSVTFLLYDSKTVALHEDIVPESRPEDIYMPIFPRKDEMVLEFPEFSDSIVWDAIPQYLPFGLAYWAEVKKDNTEYLNVRKEPSINADIVGEIHSGDSMKWWLFVEGYHDDEYTVFNGRYQVANDGFIWTAIQGIDNNYNYVIGWVALETVDVYLFC